MHGHAAPPLSRKIRLRAVNAKRGVHRGLAGREGQLDACKVGCVAAALVAREQVQLGRVLVLRMWLERFLRICTRFLGSTKGKTALVLVVEGGVRTRARDNIHRSGLLRRLVEGIPHGDVGLGRRQAPVSPATATCQS